MILIVGLGNPGKQYEYTRHNIGFRVIDAVRELADGSPWVENKKFKGVLSTIAEHAAENKITLLKPLTYMNESGISVRAWRDYYHEPDASIAVVYDDIDIPFGTMRVRDEGSSAGHKGINSMERELPDARLKKFRIGIGPKNPENIPLEDFVLQKFPPEEQKLLKMMTAGAAEYILKNCAGAKQDTVNLLT